MMPNYQRRYKNGMMCAGQTKDLDEIEKYVTSNKKRKK